MSSKPIFDIINNFEELTQIYNAEVHDLEKRIHDCERKRAEQNDDMEKDISNPETRIRLLNTEKELSNLKKILRDKTQAFSDNVKTIRLNFLNEHNSLLVKSRAKLKKMEEEKEKLRSELIPELERKLEDYHEQKRLLDSEVLKLITRINELEKEGEQWLQKM